MRTILAIVLGLVILGLFYLVARRPGAQRQRILLAFLGLWFVACAVDVALGVSHGYSVGEELLIHLVIFAVPAAAALVLARTAARS